MKDMASLAGWDTTKLWTGHSLRATAVSTLLDKGFQLAEIKRVTGHRSDNALMEYARSGKQRKRTSDALAVAPTDQVAGPSSSKDFDDDPEFESQMIEIADREEKRYKVETAIQINGTNNTFTNCSFIFN